MAILILTNLFAFACKAESFAFAMNFYFFFFTAGNLDRQAKVASVISFITIPMTIKLCRMDTYIEGLLPI